MKAGDLKHPIRLQKPCTQKTDTGRRVTSWQDVCTVMASKADVSGRDFYQAQAYNAQDTVTFGIRWRDDIRKTWRVVSGGIAYQIEEINHLGYKRDFFASEMQSDPRRGGIAWQHLRRWALRQKCKKSTRPRKTLKGLARRL